MPFFDMVAEACWFEVSPADLIGLGRLPPSTEGPVFLTGQWSIRPVASCEALDSSKVATLRVSEVISGNPIPVVAAASDRQRGARAEAIEPLGL